MFPKCELLFPAHLARVNRRYLYYTLGGVEPARMLSLRIRNRQLPHPIRETLASHTEKLCRVFAISFTELECITNMKFIFLLTPGFQRLPFFQRPKLRPTDLSYNDACALFTRRS